MGCQTITLVLSFVFVAGVLSSSIAVRSNYMLGPSLTIFPVDMSTLNYNDETNRLTFLCKFVHSHDVRDVKEGESLGDFQSGQVCYSCQQCNFSGMQCSYRHKRNGVC